MQKVKIHKHIRDRNRPLTVDVFGGRLTISIGVSTLAHAANLSDAFERDDDDFDLPPKYQVVDEDVFANEVLRALEHEGEDGITPIHRLFDAAFQRAVDDGCDGVDYEHGVSK